MKLLFPMVNYYLNKRAPVFLIIFTALATAAIGQSYPSFGPERQVTISGLTFDAMEPFISPDGKYLFFNNLNDGINTKLFYTTMVNDSTFNFVGELNGPNQTSPPHLDAVADMDSLNNFYWTSTRGYPADFDNLFHGIFNEGNVTNIGRVHGDFYIYSPGWLIMDHGISYDGQELYYNNARFDGVCKGPCETLLGIAQKVNDSTFNKLSNSDEILQNINDNSYIYYAPCISSDNLELYYTRYLKGEVTVNTVFEVCVAVRETPTGTFSPPIVLFSELIGNIVEAPTITADKQIMYYHKKIGGVHKIMMRYRHSITGLAEPVKRLSNLEIIPNPMIMNSIIKFENTIQEPYQITILDNSGRLVRTYSNILTNQVEINKGNLKAGMYIVHISAESTVIATGKLIIE